MSVKEEVGQATWDSWSVGARMAIERLEGGGGVRMEYAVVEGWSEVSENFVRKVQERLDDGWVLVGGVTVCPALSPGTPMMDPAIGYKLVQALARPRVGEVEG